MATYLGHPFAQKKPNKKNPKTSSSHRKHFHTLYSVIKKGGDSGLLPLKWSFIFLLVFFWVVFVFWRGGEERGAEIQSRVPLDLVVIYLPNWPLQYCFFCCCFLFLFFFLSSDTILSSRRLSACWAHLNVTPSHKCHTVLILIHKKCRLDICLSMERCASPAFYDSHIGGKPDLFFFPASSANWTF